MDKVVQQSAADSEESSSAAEEPAGLAEEMAGMVGKFKLNRTASAKRPQATQMKKPQAKKPLASKTNGKARGNGDTNGYQLSPEHILPLESDPDFAEF